MPCTNFSKEEAMTLRYESLEQLESSVSQDIKKLMHPERGALSDTGKPPKAVAGKNGLPKPEKPPVWKSAESRVISIFFDSLPPAELHPNYRKTNFWAVRARVSKKAREQAENAAFDQDKVDVNSIQRCEITEIFTFPTRRRMDLEGCMVACKSWIDGLTDAGVIVNDDWSHVVKLTGVPRYEKGTSQTQIIITPV